MCIRDSALSVPPSVAAQAWAPLVALRHRGLLAVTVGSLAANVVLNLALIPRVGAAGAALATVVGQTVFAGLLRLQLRQLVSTGPDVPLDVAVAKR